MREKKDLKLKKFHQWHKFLHKKYNLQYDHQFPGEVISIYELDSKLDKIINITPQLVIKDINLYDGIAWAGMLCGEHKYFLGDKDEFIKRRKLAEEIIKKWKERILKDLKLMEADLFLKHIIRYIG